jgi:hypothetical protein
MQEDGKLAIRKVCLPICPYFYIWFLELRTQEFLTSNFYHYLRCIFNRFIAKYIGWNMCIIRSFIL